MHQTMFFIFSQFSCDTRLGLPIFHSKPGSANVMYLDFDGHDIVNSYWGSYKAKPFSKVWPDSSFSASEQDDIAE